jgi:anti-sigma B factor antagonist
MDDDPRTSDLLRMSTGLAGSHASIILDGELDLSNRGQLLAYARNVLRHTSGSLEIDASKLSFVDAAGVTALVDIRIDAERAGVPFRVGAASPTTRRVLAIAGVEDILLSY